VINRLVDRDVRSKVVVTEGELNAYLAKNTTLPAAEEGYKISLIVIKKTEIRNSLKKRHARYTKRSGRERLC